MFGGMAISQETSPKSRQRSNLLRDTNATHNSKETGKEFFTANRNVRNTSTNFIMAKLGKRSVNPRRIFGTLDSLHSTSNFINAEVPEVREND